MAKHEVMDARDVPAENTCDVVRVPTWRRHTTPHHVARTKSQNGKRSRSKGHAWERAVSDALRAIWPDARRNLSQTRSARREGPDILGVPQGLWIECKCGGPAARPHVALENAAVDAVAQQRGTSEVLIVGKPDRLEPYVYGHLGTIAGLCGYAPSTRAVDLYARVPLSEFIREVALTQRHRIASALSGDPTEPFERGTP
jgi:hypothetical protein